MKKATSDQNEARLRIRLRKSTNRRTKQHRACVAGLGLRRIGDEVRLPDRPEIRGMVNRVRYLLDVEEPTCTEVK
ncbi:MAG: 50S ribosomal protein L30 [Gammaproteobacteria bacterium]|nr:50S ribosomal protein L30 [Gammaproteobacteria bacterium]MCY4200299.1 50S ribosomal protein L30 [Gammaproteobacteria bacterium]MCY4278548.1 50S ribosomal protein L30 [Gammaproteobacteria bacterium]MCY4323177.1 50S ribosomal protein L30 [Gammaproteobacteria bacterium]